MDIITPSLFGAIVLVGLLMRHQWIAQKQRMQPLVNVIALLDEKLSTYNQCAKGIGPNMYRLFITEPTADELTVWVRKGLGTHDLTFELGDNTTPVILRFRKKLFSSVELPQMKFRKDELKSDQIQQLQGIYERTLEIIERELPV
jgi:hypothetical protein